ncbi:MAG: hypothetical protein GWO20_02965 [Candidatus Korarchaeota archaeon]|nr:hypothetical protein [Candidatus Korarchaeota archaeon]
MNWLQIIIGEEVRLQASNEETVVCRKTSDEELAKRIYTCLNGTVHTSYGTGGSHRTSDVFEIILKDVNTEEEFTRFALRIKRLIEDQAEREGFSVHVRPASRKEGFRFTLIMHEKPTDKSLAARFIYGRISQILDQWRKTVPDLKYTINEQENHYTLTIPFRGLRVSIAFPQFNGCILCFASPPQKLPVTSLDNKILNTLLDYQSQWFYAFWSTTPIRVSRTILPQVILPLKFLSLETLHHAMVEITTGYWDILKAFHNSDLLPSYSAKHDFIKEIICGWKEMQMGCENISSLDHMISDTKKETTTLFFDNQIGDKLGSHHQMPKEFFDVPEPEHHDLYRFKTADLKKLLKPIIELLNKKQRKFEAKTVHQGFPSQSMSGQVIAGYHVFLGVRFSLLLCEENSFLEKETRKWQELLLSPPKSPAIFGNQTVLETFGRYILGDHDVRFDINIPLYTEKGGKLKFIPEFDPGVFEQELEVLKRSLMTSLDYNKHFTSSSLRDKK